MLARLTANPQRTFGRFSGHFACAVRSRNSCEKVEQLCRRRGGAELSGPAAGDQEDAPERLRATFAFFIFLGVAFAAACESGRSQSQVDSVRQWSGAGATLT